MAEAMNKASGYLLEIKGFKTKLQENGVCLDISLYITSTIVVIPAPSMSALNSKPNCTEGSRVDGRPAHFDDASSRLHQRASRKPRGILAEIKYYCTRGC